jgi:hypothetical protein
MNDRVTNSTACWLVLAGVVVASGFLGLAAARHALAEHWAASSDAGQWLRAAQLEPANPENWYRLGRYRQLDFEHADLPLAISYYQRATALEPASALYWMDLAGAYETNGNAAQAEQAFRTAQQDYPISGEVAWRFGNFLLRQDRTDEAFQQIRRAISVDPTLTTLAVSRCWRSTQDIDRILKFALPPNPEAYWGAIDFLVGANELDAAMAVWKQIAMEGTSFPLSKAFPFLDDLIGSGHIADARTVWLQAIASAKVTPQPAPPGSLIWDGGFEGELLNGGFAWRYQSVDGADVNFDAGVAHSGSRSLRVTFVGNENVNFQNIWQFVPVEPKTRYRFSGYLRADELTTDAGIHFQIDDLSHPADSSQFKPDPSLSTQGVIGTQPWALDDLEFTTGPQTNMLRVILRRLPSDRIANKITGTVWVDDVTLTPLPAAGAAGK